MADADDQKPTPDPTRLTTEQLIRTEEHLSLLIAGAKELLETQLRATDDLCGEKFRAIETQLLLIERQRVESKGDATATRIETKNDTTKALEAALVAAKDQVAAQAESFSREFSKFEGNVDKQIQAMGTTFNTEIKAMREVLDDVKLGLTEVKSVKVGGQENRQSMVTLLSVLVTLIIIGGFVAAIWPK